MSEGADAGVPITTLPAGGVLESTTPPPPPIPAPSKVSFGAAFATVPSRADAFLAHLLRCLQTRAGTDVVLQFACYSARLSGSALESLSRSALRHAAQKLVALAFQLPPQTSVVLATAQAPPAAAAAMRLAAQFKALSALMSETRTVNRLWGLLGLYFGLKRLVVRTRAGAGAGAAAADAGEAVFDSLVGYSQVVLLIFYQVFENLSFLGGKKVLNINPALRAKMALWSVKCWGGWIGIELARLLVERARMRATSGGVDEKEAKADAAARSKKWRKSFLRNLAWAPIVVHWTSPNGALPDMAVSLLAMYPSASQMLDLWRDTA
ncbi:Uncharacterized protein ESCO_004637 [Escovopsis weberi]|uniref:Peroxin 11C n=1 Tax=Escovopsis weberi TaxID=150374 RepID=A0A0M9VRM3_ESCWE|nr:Uncharacterized protein ESCO_004637 [Escovopsis weberi]